jgi:hypothetical protein
MRRSSASSVTQGGGTGGRRAHLGIGKQLVVDEFADAHLLHARVCKRDPNSLDTVLDLQFERDDDGRREQVRVGEQEVLDGGQVPGRRALGQSPFRRSASDSATFGLPNLDSELLRRERVAEEGLRDCVRENDRRETIRFGCGGRSEVLEDGLRLEVVVGDVVGVLAVSAVEV